MERVVISDLFKDVAVMPLDVVDRLRSLNSLIGDLRYIHEQIYEVKPIKVAISGDVPNMDELRAFLLQTKCQSGQWRSCSDTALSLYIAKVADTLDAVMSSCHGKSFFEKLGKYHAPRRPLSSESAFDQIEGALEDLRVEYLITEGLLMDYDLLADLVEEAIRERTPTN